MADKLSPAAQSGTFRIGGDLPVHRLGFGAMRITGKGIWGEPEDRDEAIRVLRRSLELGINFIDTADSYGPEVSERLIAEALRPYPKGLVIATKAGFRRRDRVSGSRTAGLSTSGGRSRAASAGSGWRRSTCCSSTASTLRCRSRTSSVR
jgi:aryl-alcohol dehydrogenase-like predicted oxidoreductase